MTKQEKEFRKVHEFFDKHEWVFIPAREMGVYEKAITNDRRVCKQCMKVQFRYGYSSIWSRGAEEWYTETSALAIDAIRKVLKDSPNGFKDSYQGP
jgi:hypothetical protein